MIVGRYGEKNFTWGAEGINTFSNFSLNYTAKSQDQADKDGTPVTNVKGVEIGGFAINILSQRHDAIDPDKEIDEWKSYIEDGEGREFYVGERKIGEYRWRVSSLTISDIRLDANANTDTCNIDIGFEEVAPEPSQDKKKKKSKAQKKSAPAIQSPQVRMPNVPNVNTVATLTSPAQYAPKNPTSPASTAQYKAKYK